MSKSIANLLSGLVNLLVKVQGNPYRQQQTKAVLSEQLHQYRSVDFAGKSLKFFCPSSRSLAEFAHLTEDEPETLHWLEGIDPKDAVLWDIGANVGAYSCLAASRGIYTLAFEPSAATYAVMVRNLEINGLSELVEAYCLALDDKTHLNYLYMANTEAGHSMHAFGQDKTVEGQIAVKFRQSVPGFTMDQLIEIFPAIKKPTHVKLDVDSIEDQILRGGAKTFQDSVQSIIVEIDGDRAESGDTTIDEILTGYGFKRRDLSGLNVRRNAIFDKA